MPARTGDQRCCLHVWMFGCLVALALEKGMGLFFGVLRIDVHVTGLSSLLRCRELAV